MKKRTIIIIILIIVLLAIVGVIGIMFMFKYFAFYHPGRLKENMAGRLDVNKQELKEGGYLKVEEGIDLYYFTQGKGETPVLMIHGGPGAPPSSKWNSLDSLGEKYKFYYYHQRGCGKSTRPFDRFESKNNYQNMKQLDEKLGMSQQLADIERIRKILGVEKIILIGHSYGGFLATLYAVEFPENVAKMILVSPANLLKMPQNDDQNTFEDLKSYLSENKKAEFDAWQKEYFDYNHIFSKSEADLQKINVKYLEFYEEAMKAKGLEIPKEENENLEENMGGWMVHGLYISTGIKYDYTDYVKNINVSSLVLYGEEDFLASAYKDYGSLLGNSEVKGIDGASHFIYRERPEEFKKTIEEFMK